MQLKPHQERVVTEQKELAEKLVRLSGMPTRIVFDPTKPAGQPRRHCDTRLAERLLEFHAQVPLEEGLTRTIAWYRENMMPVKGAT